METKEITAQGNTPQDVPATQADKAKQMEDEYNHVFLKRKELKNRKSVYISEESHTAITRLVHVFALDGTEISVGGFIDNIIAEHMDSFKKHIAIKCQKQLEKFR